MKTVLITGATGTIGKATAIELAKNNCKVLLVGRNQDKLKAVKSEIELLSNNIIDIFVADLSEKNSVINAVNNIKKKYNSLNAVVNVAAVFKKQHLENSKGYEYMFATNHLGPFMLTIRLLELLKAGKPSRVINVSAPSVTKIRFENLEGNVNSRLSSLEIFGATKMMNLMFTYSLARKLKGSGISTNVFHPGLVKSDLTKEMPALLSFIFKILAGKPDMAAKMLCKLAINNNYQNGTFIKFNGKTLRSNKYSYNENIQDQLWKISEELS